MAYRNQFQPGPRCGNCDVYSHNRDGRDRYHDGAFCRKEEGDPKACGTAFVSRHNGRKKERHCKPWQQGLRA